MVCKLRGAPARNALIAGLVVLGGCVTMPDGAPAVDEPTPTPVAPGLDTALLDDTAVEPPCVTIARIDPADGSRDVYARAPIRIDLTADGRGALDVSLQTAQGEDLGASVVAWSPDGRRALVTTPRPLPTEADLLLRATTRCTERIVPFRTSDVGQPIATGDVAGRMYELDLSGLRSLVPVLDDVSLSGGWSDLTYGLTVEEWNPIDRSYEVAMYGAPELEIPAPAACFRRVELAPTAGWTLIDNPFLRLDVSGADAQMPLVLAGPLGLAALDVDTLFDYRVPVELVRLTLSASVAPDRQSLEGLRITTTTDARAVLAALDERGVRWSVDRLCADVQRYDAACQPCPDGVRACVTADLDGLRAEAYHIPLDRLAVCGPGF